MEQGDVKILRNAGARVTDDVLRTLVLATYLLDVTRILVMPHTHCKMASATEEEIHRQIFDGERRRHLVGRVPHRSPDQEDGAGLRRTPDPQLPALPATSSSPARSTTSTPVVHPRDY